MEAAVKAVEQAFAAHGRGDIVMPPKVYLPLTHHDGDFRAMPAYLAGAAGVKWVSAYPNNPSKHRLPAVIGLFILSDPSNALPLAVMDGTLLTAIRTGAASAVASKHLSRKSPKTIGFIGCGVQSRYVLEAHRVVFGTDLVARVADIARDAAERFAAESGGEAVSVEEAAACDIVCTTTPSRQPIVSASWLSPSAHINAIGADAPGKQELDPAILKRARVFVDDVHQASESGEINVPLRAGEIREADIAGTLGEIVAGRLRGRRSVGWTVFDSTGLAIQDVAVARVIYETARDRGLGGTIDFSR
jgi:ornithine cyclodeaminase/alanine dehydrogenase